MNWTLAQFSFEIFLLEKHPGFMLDIVYVFLLYANAYSNFKHCKNPVHTFVNSFIIKNKGEF